MIMIERNTKVIFIFLFFILLYIIIIFKLYLTQIKNFNFYNNLGQNQYKIKITSKPARAEIVDRNNIPIAINKESLAAFIIPSNIEKPKELNKFLSKYFPQAYKKLCENKDKHFMYIKRKLSQEEIKLIEQHNLEDIKLLKEPSRFYPIESVGPIVGITNIDNQGLFGIELLYNKILAGEPTTQILEKDARSGHFYFKNETKIEGESSRQVMLSIDSNLQFLAHEELKESIEEVGAKEGSVLVINPDNGEIIVMANYPDFDPNNTENIDNYKTKNHIITDAYELGSVIKMFLALAALEEKVVTPDEIIDCENKKETSINGIKFSTWKENGKITFSEVIQNSNNIGVAKVAIRLGPKLYDHYKKLGFGQRIGIFPGENWGFVNPPNNWSKASIISLSFGYELSANLLQLAQAVSIIVNNGYLIKPTLIKSQEKNIKKTGPLYKQESIDKLKDILRKTITEGTSNKANIAGYNIMGKTGTARLLTNGKYEKNKNIFTFIGIIQKDSYKRIVITFIKETTKPGAYASTIAVPLFEKIAHKMLIHDKIL